MSEQQAISTGLEALKLIVTGGIGAAIIGIIGKVVVDRKLQKQKAEYDKQLESLKSKLHLETQKQVIEYTSLHDKQAQIIADFYAQLAGLYICIERLMSQYRTRETKEQIEKELPDLASPPKQIGLTAKEQEAVDAVHACNKNLFEFYRKNRIYFSLVICNLTDRFCGLASYLAIEYPSVTYKDEAGNLYVNSKVKEVWDKAIETIPQLLTQLEIEFRDILGVKS
jgi:hypothetical protein